MPRVKMQTLTEQMFYILLCLKDEASGIELLEKIPRVTKGRVKVGSGTLYNLIEQFVDEGLILETKVEGRKRSYILSEKGKSRLSDEYIRIFSQAVDYKITFGS